jgi:hypothetical protein
LRIFHPIAIADLKRLGNQFDGGYVVHLPSLLDADCLLNYGVGYNVAFEEDFYRITGKPTLAFDPTLTFQTAIGKLGKGHFIPFLRHVKNHLLWFFKLPALNKYQIRLIEEGIGVFDDTRYKSLGYHINQFQLPGKKLILKVDVEGAEYDVLSDDTFYHWMSNVIQLIIEFHEVQNHMGELSAIMKKIAATHTLIHIHANNHDGTFDFGGKNVPETLEMTLLNHSYCAEKEMSRESYPIGDLDQPCNKSREDIILDFFY